MQTSILGSQRAPRAPTLLSKTIEGKKLYLYLAISEEVVNATLVRNEEKVKWLIYYMSKRLLDEVEKTSKGLMETNIDPCLQEDEATTGPVEELIEVQVDPNEPSCVIKISK